MVVYDPFNNHIVSVNLSSSMSRKLRSFLIKEILRMRPLPASALIILAGCIACAGPSPVPLSVAPGAQASSPGHVQAVTPDSPKPMILYPKLLEFTTPNVPPEKASIEHFKGGQWTETCDQKGVAHVLQEGAKTAPHIYVRGYAACRGALRSAFQQRAAAPSTPRIGRVVDHRGNPRSRRRLRNQYGSNQAAYEAGNILR